MTMLTQTQVDNWDNLTPEQRAYFTRLAEGDPDRCGRQFFEDEVPQNLQDDPEGLDIYLNGGTVTVPVEEHWIGRNGVTNYTKTRTVEIKDRDWSHDTSKANGGSDSADNGRFESASTNRARGADNSTAAEQAAADEQSARDAQYINDRVDEPDDAAIDKMATVFGAGSLVADAAELAVDGVLPLTAGIYVGSKLVDAGVDKKVVVAGGLGTTLLAFTPPGQIVVGGYFAYKLGRFIWKAGSKIAKA